MGQQVPVIIACYIVGAMLVWLTFYVALSLVLSVFALGMGLPAFMIGEIAARNASYAAAALVVWHILDFINWKNRRGK